MTPATKAVLDILRGEFTGRVLTPGDDDYAAEASGFDVSLVHTAPMVVAPVNNDDVVAAVRAAARAGVPMTVIGGGHGDIPAVTDASCSPPGTSVASRSTPMPAPRKSGPDRPGMTSWTS
jgi:hypothetical protein